MTGYHLSIGYNGGFTSSYSKEEAFEKLVWMVEAVRMRPLSVRPSNPACTVPWTEVHEEVVSLNYPTDGPALRVRREDMEILLCCSGGDEYRRVKEECAFHTSMFLICAMANLGIPVSMVIA